MFNSSPRHEPDARYQVGRKNYFAGVIEIICAPPHRCARTCCLHFGERSARGGNPLIANIAIASVSVGLANRSSSSAQLTLQIRSLLTQIAPYDSTPATPLRLSRALLWSVSLASLLPVTAMATEEPKFEILNKVGDFELRQYAPMVVAETLVSGSQDEASSQGFRVIAGYIFGDNKRTGVGTGAEKITMTAPVLLEKQVASQKIDMTAPVTMDKVGDRWRVHFVMPSQYKIADLPTPNNSAIALREIPASKYAALRFSGFASEEKVAAKTKELTDWVIARGSAAVSTPQLARYDPPWTLPFMRRNEILVEIR